VEPFAWDDKEGVAGVVKVYLEADQDNDRVAATIERHVPSSKRAESLPKLFRTLSSCRAEESRHVVALIKFLLLETKLFTADDIVSGLKNVMTSFHETSAEEDMKLPEKLGKIIAGLATNSERHFDLGAFVRMPEAREAPDEYYEDEAPKLFCSIVQELINSKKEAATKEILSKAGLSKMDIIVRDNFENKCKTKFADVHSLLSRER